MKLAEELKCDGLKFETIRDLANHYHVHPSTVGRRLRGGWTVEQAVGIAPTPKRLGHGISVVIEGVKYPHLEAVANAYGIAGDTLRARLYNGYSLLDAAKGNLKPRVSARAKTVTYKGKSHRSHEQLAEAFGLSNSVVSRRLKRGWTLAQALGDEPSPPRFRNFEGHARDVKWKQARTTASGVEPLPDSDGYKLYLITNTVNGKKYVGITIGELSKRLKQHVSASKRGRKAPLPNAIRFYGESSFHIELLRSDAESFDELQDQEIQEIAKRGTIGNGYNAAIGGALGASKAITVSGNTFASHAQASEHYGVDATVFGLRMNRLKWSPEEAAGLVRRDWSGKAQQVIANGIAYSSIYEAAKALGKDHRKVYDRYSEKGWTIEQALDLAPPPDSVKFQGIAVTVNGIAYRSMGAAASALGISSEPFRLRITAGATPDEAYRRTRKTK